MTRLPGGALLIVIGIALLVLALYGRLDRMAAAWHYVISSDNSATLPGGVAQAGAAVTPTVAVAPLVEPAAWHVGQMLGSLAPTVALAGVTA